MYIALLAVYVFIGLVLSAHSIAVLARAGHKSSFGFKIIVVTGMVISWPLVLCTEVLETLLKL